MQTKGSSYLYDRSSKKTEYYDKRSKIPREEYFKLIKESTTLYIGNLNINTTEEKLYNFFSNFVPIKNIVVGIHKKKFTPCGFCFVELYSRADTESLRTSLNGVFVDNKKIYMDYDPGFKEGRQYGRGHSGGQVKDEFTSRNSYSGKRYNDGGERNKRRKYD